MDTYVILRRSGWQSGAELEEAAARSANVGDNEMSDYHRPDLIFTKEMLLVEPFERTPLRGEGE